MSQEAGKSFAFLLQTEHSDHYLYLPIDDKGISREVLKIILKDNPEKNFKFPLFSRALKQKILSFSKI